MNDIIQLSNGNPGALNFLIALETEKGTRVYDDINARLAHCPSIKGTNLYVLWSDLCNQDMTNVWALCGSDCPNEVLEDACNRQDYSGRDLVKEYM